MEPHADEYEAFSADADSTILAYGYYGGICGALAFSLFLWIIPFFVSGGRASMEWMFGALLLIVLLVGLYYCIRGAQRLLYCLCSNRDCDL